MSDLTSSWDGEAGPPGAALPGSPRDALPNTGDPVPNTGDALPNTGDALPNTGFVQRWQPTETGRLLRELLDLAEQVAPVIARRADLSHTELRAMELLVDDPHGPVELSHRLGVTSAASSGVIDRLAARGHVLRQAHPTDGRRTIVRVTDSGREEVLGYLMPMFLALAELDAGLAEHDRAVVERYLRGAIEAIRRVL